MHVVWLVRRVWNKGVEFQIFICNFEHTGRFVCNGLAQIVFWQVAQQRTRVVERILFIVREVVRNTRSRVVSASSTEFFHANVFTGHGLNDVRAGDEHVRCLVDHNHKVG